MIRSRVCTLHSFPHRANLFGDVDRRRTPRDAPTTSHTTQFPKLVHPGRQLVRHPLAVTRFGRITDTSTVNVRKIQSEARIPPAPALGALARDVCDILHRSAEACGAGHRAIRAAQAASSEFVP